MGGDRKHLKTDISFTPIFPNAHSVRMYCYALIIVATAVAVLWLLRSIMRQPRPINNTPLPQLCTSSESYVCEETDQDASSASTITVEPTTQAQLVHNNCCEIEPSAILLPRFSKQYGPHVIVNIEWCPHMVDAHTMCHTATYALCLIQNMLCHDTHLYCKQNL